MRETEVVFCVFSASGGDGGVDVDIGYAAAFRKCESEGKGRERKLHIRVSRYPQMRESERGS